MEKVAAYKCSFCKDSSRNLFLSASGCKKHERICWLNPARKSCATCAHIEDDDENSTSSQKAWSCYKHPDIIPFKQKIDNCPDWHESGSVFSNETIKYDRPIERKK